MFRKLKLIKSGIISRSQIHHKKKYRDATPRPTQKDFDKIYDDIESREQLRSVVIDEAWNLVDGYTRDEILRKQRIDDIKFTQYQFDSEEEKLNYINSMNVKRRHLGPWQRFEASIPTYKYEQKEAKTRQKKGTLQSPDVKGTAIQKAAKEADISPKTYERALEIKEKATTDQIKKLQTGDSKIRTVHSQIVIKNRKPTKAEIPVGEWNVLEIDFPWGYRNENVGDSGGGAANNKYPTMPPKEILDKEVPKFKKIIAKDAVVFMWVTTPLLSEIIQLRILEEMGFKYKTMITWHKKIPEWFFGGRALGFWYKIETEHCIVGIRGNVKPFRSDLPNFIETDMLRHSEKPKEFKELFEESTKYIPGRKMFEGYQRTPRKGWTGYGNQIKGAVTAV